MIRARQVTRETNAVVFDGGKRRPVYVTLDPSAGLLTFRLKKRRQGYTLPVGFLYMEALHRHVALEKKRKAEERKARRKAKA